MLLILFVFDIKFNTFYLSCPASMLILLDTSDWKNHMQIKAFSTSSHLLITWHMDKSHDMQQDFSHRNNPFVIRNL